MRASRIIARLSTFFVNQPGVRYRSDSRVSFDMILSFREHCSCLCLMIFNYPLLAVKSTALDSLHRSPKSVKLTM